MAVSTEEVVEELTLHGLGTSVDLQVLAGDEGPQADAALVARIRSAWVRCLTPAPGQPRPFPCHTRTVAHDTDKDLGLGRPVQVRHGAQVSPSPDDALSMLVASGDQHVLMQQITQRVTRALILSQRGRLLMLHASGVSDPDTGRSIIFVAPGGTGKTTLARALGKRWSYLSDETIGIDAARQIWAYPKPLSIRGGKAYKDEVAPSALGLLPQSAPAQVSKIIVLDRRGGVDTPTFEPLGTLEAMEVMGPESSSLAALDRGLHVFADVLEHTGGAERWRYTEHTDLIARAEHILAGEV